MNALNNTSPLESLSDLSWLELQQALHAAQEELASRKEVDRTDALMQILNLVNKFQIPFDELTEFLQSSNAIYTEHGRLKKIYINNKNKNDKPWIGVGRRPKWIRDAIARGEDIEQYAVETSDDSQHTTTWFYNPERPTQRWNGVGCKPVWFKELEAQNIDMGQYKTIL